ncbi:TIGR03752 family integrating conjugative element protein [Marinobacterium lutimaris]|nr:TIGR03752 family integrating conjugative element protein [Marinobacterium lutimaris]
MKSNLLIKIMAVILVGVGLMIIITKMKSGASQEDLQAVEQKPQREYNGLADNAMTDEQLEKEYGVDFDSPEETMRTLTTQIQSLRTENERIADENATLRRDASKLLDMEDSISSRVEGRLEQAQGQVDEQSRELEQQRRRSETLLGKLESRLAELERGGGSDQGSATNAAGYDIGAANIPDGLGYDSSGTAQLIWINPLDAQVDTKQGTITMPEFKAPNLGFMPEGEEVRLGRKGNQNEVESVKAYTLPANATLMGSTSMTALLGRIPVGGQIPDPYPFKIIVGPENLSSNGIHIPDVQGITMSGIAKGDWTLSCVSGEIHSMTFTFQDGSISTYPEPGEGNSNTNRVAIGWFSDQFGIPCVTGKRITNAPSYLASRIGLGAVSAYAQARASAEYTNTVDSDGTSRSTLTGDAMNAAENQAISGGVDEVSDWLDARQEQSFDAIYVAPGTPVHVHLEKQIAIDYPINDTGRKVQHSEYIDYQVRQASTVRALD